MHDVRAKRHDAVARQPRHVATRSYSPESAPATGSLDRATEPTGGDEPEPSTVVDADDSAAEAGTARAATRRRTREQLRQLVLEAGSDILWEEGLAAGAEHVTFAKVFDRVEQRTGTRITHASVIRRIWENQEEFQADVLSRLASLDEWDVRTQVSMALTMVSPFDLSTAEARWRAAREVCRVGADANFRAIIESRLWPRWMGIWALTVADAGSPRKKDLMETLVRAEDASIDQAEGAYRTVMRGTGLRIRAPFTLRQYTICVDAFMQGCAIREGVDGAITRTIDRPTGRGGEGQPWNLFTLGLDALTHAFVEVDPEWTPRVGVGAGRRRTNVFPAGATTVVPDASSGPAMATAEPRRSRSSRRSRAELRELLLSAGMGLLVEDGLGTGAGHLTFKRVFERLESTQGIRLTNAAVIGRIWSNQAEYQTEVMTTIASDDAMEVFGSTVRSLQTVLATTDRSSVESRRRSLRAMARAAGEANTEMLATSRRWHRWVGVWALVMARTSGSVAAGPVSDALRAGFDTLVVRYEELCTRMFEHFGFRLRDGLTLRQLMTSAAALAEGCALRHDAVDPRVSRIPRPTGPAGAVEDWTIFGVGLDALFDTFLEPVPGWSPGRAGGRSPDRVRSR